MIYADQANPQIDTLSGVVITKIKDNQIKAVYTAERVKIYFNPQLRFYEVQITAHNTYQIGAEGGRSISLGKFSLRMEFGSLLGDDIKFKKIDEMKKIRDVDVTQFYPIEKLARQIYSQYTAELLAEDISGRFTDEPNGFYTLYSADRLVKFTAGRCNMAEEKEIELFDKIVVIEYDEAGKQHLRTLKCEKASLHLEGDELAPTLTMELDNPKWQREEGTEGVALGWLRIRGLIIPKNVRDTANQFATEDGLDAKKMAAELSTIQKGQSVKLKRLQNQLQTEIQKTLAEIEAEIHSRLVFGIGCVSLIMIGIGLGILLRDGHLLSAFGASSLPAAVLVVCIMMGKNITKNSDAQAGSGIVLMWGGMLFLSLLAIVVYRKLLKN